MTVLNIAIAVDGLSEHWLGGVNYFRNLVTVFDAAADPGLRLHLLTDEPGFFNDLHPSPRVMVHALGMYDGTVKNGVETFMSYLLYAYDASYLSRLNAALTGNRLKGYALRLSLSSGLMRHIAEHFPQGKSGAVVVMNYRTGELLALNSFPNFDPLSPQGVMSDPDKPYINNATQWRSAPGSTFTQAHMAMEETVPASRPQKPPARVARFHNMPRMTVPSSGAMKKLNSACT